MKIDDDDDNNNNNNNNNDSLCGLVVRVPGYRSRGSGFDFRGYHIF
jgi:hypothetical protein